MLLNFDIMKKKVSDGMKKGFTLVELLAVIVILSIIGMITVPMAVSYIEKSKENLADIPISIGW